MYLTETIKPLRKLRLQIIFIFNLCVLIVNAEHDFYKFLINVNTKTIDSLVLETKSSKTANKIKAHNYLGAYYESISNYT